MDRFFVDQPGKLSPKPPQRANSAIGPDDECGRHHCNQPCQCVGMCQALCMSIDPGLVAIVSSLILIVLSALWSVIGWMNRHSWRAVLRGMGVGLTVLGLWIAGVMNLTVNGIQSLVHWYERQLPLNIMMFISLTIAGIGVLLAVVSSFIPPITRERNKERKSLQKEREAAALANLNASKVQYTPQAAPPSAPETSSGDSGLDL